MKNNTIKLLSIIVMIVMLMSFLPIVANAYYIEVDENGNQIIYDTPSDNFPSETPNSIYEDRNDHTIDKYKEYQFGGLVEIKEYEETKKESVMPFVLVGSISILAVSSGAIYIIMKKKK